MRTVSVPSERMRTEMLIVEPRSSAWDSSVFSLFLPLFYFPDHLSAFVVSFYATRFLLSAALDPLRSATSRTGWWVLWRLDQESSPPVTGLTDGA